MKSDPCSQQSNVGQRAVAGTQTQSELFAVVLTHIRAKTPHSESRVTAGASQLYHFST